MLRMKVLLDAGASLDFQTFSGGTALTAAVGNEDSDPDVVRMILEKLKSSCSATEFASILNYKRASKTLKWKSIRFASTLICRAGFSTKTGLMEYLATQSGATPLNHAVMRGDVEIVKLLLEHGADPYLDNDLRMNAFDVCEKYGPYPSVADTLWETVSTGSQP